jgi:hypothetical protein
MPSTGSIRWLIVLVCGALTALGCSTDTQQGDATGSLALNLVLADGVVINTVSWEITRDDMEPMSGTIDTSSSGSTASVEVYGLLPGDGYLVELSATSEDGEVSCRGSAAFAVAIGVATDVMVMLNCKLPMGTGAARVNGEVNICAQLHKVVVSPLQTSVGNDIDLSAMGEDMEGDAVRYRWTGTGGSIADPNAAVTTYTCGETGPQTISISASDDDFEHCMDDWTVPVTCIDGNLCEDVDCDDGNECTSDDCDPADGSCINAPVDEGTACDGGAGSCSSGECVPIDLCEDVDCDDGNECTNDVCDPADGSCSNPAVDDGTICDGGAGVCTEGVCVEVDLCEDVECPSDNECVEDGTCDPADGMCIEGANKPDGTPCSFGGFCDGAGNCKINTCAEVTQVLVAPLQQSLGNDIDLSGMGSDVDGDPVATRWTGTGGSIADPSALVTTYTCGEVGEQSVTFAVSDDDFTFCIDELSVVVTCVDAVE